MKLAVNSNGPSEDVYLVLDYGDDAVNTKFVAHMDRGDLTQKEQVQIAEFIVRACNSHDELVSLCEDMLGWLALSDVRHVIRSKHGEAAAYDKLVRRAAKARREAMGA